VANNEGLNQDQMVEPSVDQRLQTRLIAETIDDLDGCQSFARWVRETGLEYILRRGGLHTLFAPSDEAFRAPASGAPEEFINRYLLSGAWKSFDLSRCNRVKAASGETLSVSEAGMRIGNARIIRADVPCTNGVVHIVGAELQPASAS
jgi:uncharacterized surface protein with fasciclin (FAS1) repeats